MNVKIGDAVEVIAFNGRLGRPGLVGWKGVVEEVRGGVTYVTFTDEGEQTAFRTVPMHSRNLRVIR